MRNEKYFKKIRQAWLAHYAYPSLTANLPNPTCFPDVFLLPYKALLWAPQLLKTPKTPKPHRENRVEIQTIIYNRIKMSNE